MKDLNKYYFNQKEKMGIFWSSEPNVEIIIEDLEHDDKFIEYQDKFQALVPSRKLYVDDEEIVIEIENKNSYSVSRAEFDWKNPKMGKVLYEYLDELYKTYEHSQIISNNQIIKFIKNSINTDVSGWDEWLDNNFDHQSDGYKLFKAMGYEISTIGKISIYPPQYIWFIKLEQLINSNKYIVRDSIKEPMIKSYKNPKDIIDQDGNVLAIIAQIENKWRYIGVATDCLKNINDIYKSQIC